MRISLDWLGELVEIPPTTSPQALAEMLTMAGFEVEDIEERSTWADGVVVGYVLDRQPHPNADKLSVCQVDIGSDEPQQIVCGAANVRQGLYVPVATLGSYLPKIDLKIKPAKLRGVESKGMICSLSELGLEKDAEGIHEFSQPDLQPGQDVRSLLGLTDVILDLTSTANRADALSMVGIAREIAALTGAELKLPQPPQVTPSPDKGLKVQVTGGGACPAYFATVLESVRVGPSPAWLKARLQAAGTRSINNVVDITNYVMLEWGQPLHAFDRDRLQQITGQTALTLGVRFAETGETLTTLDGGDRPLTPQTLVITAANQPVALAGVMGGASSEVHDGTTTLMLEAAVFDSAVVRRSARAQGLRTEASARYERGVNQAELELANQRAIALLQELAGAGVTATAAVDQRNRVAAAIQLRLEKVNQILGPVLIDEVPSPLQAEVVEQILTALNCTPTQTAPGVWDVTVPPYRLRDLEREIDLIEEIARVHGYNNFCDTLPEKSEAGFLSLEQAISRKLRAACRAVGLTELLHYSLGKPDQERQIVLANPLFTEYSALRTNLVDALIDAFQYNLEQGNGALNGFEIGRIFSQEEEGLFEEDCLAGILGGDPRQGRWVTSGREQPLTWFEAKGKLTAIFQQLGLAVEFQPDQQDARLHPGRTASLWLAGARLGTFGQIHPQLRTERGLPDEIYVFALDLDVILDELAKDEVMVPRFSAYSNFPPSSRDIAFFISTDTSVAQLQQAMQRSGGKLLDHVELFDQYQGKNVPEGQRSLAFRLVYRAGDRTLTEDDIDPVHQKVRDVLTDKFRAQLRS
jgi:phenylalanyl-tRNA synthetase beta chain